MSNIMTLILVFAAGGLLGAIFFGGLWWTVRKGLHSRRPALWFMSSFVLRTLIVLAGFSFLSDAQWERMLACLLGFLAARAVVARLLRPPKEASHVA
jgi:F1F0 ATPase subunit 2